MLIYTNFWFSVVNNIITVILELYKRVFVNLFMKLSQYKMLGEKEQYDLLWNEGILIDACFDGSVKKLLYAIGNFFVELWFDALSNKILWKLSFKQGVLLEKYLNKYTLPIDIGNAF